FSEGGVDARAHFAVAVYNEDGTFDGAFQGGRFLVDFGAQSARGRGVALPGDGTVIVAGEATLGLNNFDSADVVVAKFNSDGTPDASFGSGGQTHTHFANATAEVHGVDFLGGGRIVAGGSVGNVRAEGIDLIVVSYTRDGAPDTTFIGDNGNRGKLRTNLGLNTEIRANAMAVQHDGEIAIAGEVDISGVIQCL